MFRGGNHWATACAVSLLACTSCALQAPKPVVPEVPAAFDNATPGATAAWPGKDWYRGFQSPALDGLLRTAASANLDLAAARARITQADARARQAGAAILPSVDAVGNGNFLAGHSSNGSAHELDWSALLSASYEVDFWGKNRATANAARFLGTAARADRDTLALTTLAGVANGYFELLSIREQLKIAQSNLDAARGPARGGADTVQCRRLGSGDVGHAAHRAGRRATGRSRAAAARAGSLGGPGAAGGAAAGRLPGRGRRTGCAQRAAGSARVADGIAHPPPRCVLGRGQPAGGGCGPGRRARGAAADTDSHGGRRGAEPCAECGRHDPLRRGAHRESGRRPYAKHFRWWAAARGA